MSRKWRIAVALAVIALLLIGGEAWIESLAVDQTLKRVEARQCVSCFEVEQPGSVRRLHGRQRRAEAHPTHPFPTEQQYWA